MNTAEKLYTIHERNYSPPKPLSFFEKLVDGYYLAESDIADWFIALLDDLLQGRTNSRMFPDTTSEVLSILEELRIDANWQFDFWGEGMEIILPGQGLDLIINEMRLDNEGRGCCSYEIRRAQP